MYAEGTPTDGATGRPTAVSDQLPCCPGRLTGRRRLRARAPGHARVYTCTCVMRCVYAGECDDGKCIAYTFKCLLRRFSELI